MVRSPYDVAPDRSFWSRAVARDFRAEALVPPGPPLLRPGDRVMSAGSCFAAHIVPHLERSGFAYVRTETRPAFLKVPPETLGYDGFSAAYGNIYTPRQLHQLLLRCQGEWHPQERVWQDGATFVDPFRPGLRYRAGSAREFDLLTAQHLACVRRAVEVASVFVFTLGLTEAWVARVDGAVFPACPGTIAGSFDPARHGFHNFTVGETIADLHAAIVAARQLNPALRIILTVSPVPLVATASGSHVLEATIHSKSVLRAAAGEVVRDQHDVRYFPAYEIVTGPQAPDCFFEADRRSVSAVAVETVMAALLAHCQTTVLDKLPPVARPPAAPPPPAGPRTLMQMVVEAECDEILSDPGATASG